MRREVIPGVDRPLTVSEITEISGPAVQKKEQEYKEFIRKGGKLDGWREYEAMKERDKQRGQK